VNLSLSPAFSRISQAFANQMPATSNALGRRDPDAYHGCKAPPKRARGTTRFGCLKECGDKRATTSCFFILWASTRRSPNPPSVAQRQQVLPRLIFACGRRRLSLRAALSLEIRPRRATLLLNQVPGLHSFKASTATKPAQPRPKAPMPPNTQRIGSAAPGKGPGRRWPPGAGSPSPRGLSLTVSSGPERTIPL
jgi:hypothetical protein